MERKRGREDVLKRRRRDRLEAPLPPVPPPARQTPVALRQALPAAAAGPDWSVANPPTDAPPYRAADWSAPPQRRHPGRRCLIRRRAPWSRRISQVRHLHAETPRSPIRPPSRRPSVLPTGQRHPSAVALDAAA